MGNLAAWVLSPESYFLGTIPASAVALFFVALLLSSLGFARIVYFISVGYGLSVAGVAFFSFVYFRSSGNLGALLHMMLVVLYGFRLAGYLTLRERRTSFQEARREVDDQFGEVGSAARFGIWIGVSVLYVVIVSPVLFHLSTLYAALHRVTTAAQSGFVRPLVTVGLVAGYLGFVVEWRSDAQKTRWKRHNPKSYCSSGLYRVVRYPNYFGEILLWTGSWIAGVPFYRGAAQWAASLAGLAVIVLIMLGSTRRLEQSQNRRYGADPAYAQYTKTVPVLIPFLPLYSLKKLKVYLG
jgi:steroid 5-alpha reductase family enzyme